MELLKKAVAVIGWIVLILFVIGVIGAMSDTQKKSSNFVPDKNQVSSGTYTLYHNWIVAE